MRKIGFTGTRFGMTLDQKIAFINLIKEEYKSEENQFIFSHGNCVGADKEAAEILRYYQKLVEEAYYKFTTIEIFPGPGEEVIERSYGDIVHLPKGHLARNRDIVNNSDILIACPDKTFEEQRSGTWYTIRYARKRKVPIKIIFPNGIEVNE